MPRKKQSSTRPNPKSQHAARQNASSRDAIPEVYRDMLVEAFNEDREAFQQDSRPTKRRKVSEEPATPASPVVSEAPSIASSVTEKQQQIIFDDFENSDESDVEFEDVEIAQNEAEEESTPQNEHEEKTLRLDLSNNKTGANEHTVQRRKPVGKAEKQFRLDVHKWHVLCLLVHVAIRSQWCNNEQIHAILKPLAPRKVISLLHMDESKLQSQRNFAFNKGIEELCGIWRLHWKIAARGMQRAVWKETVDMEKEIDDAEDPVDMDDFRKAAKECSGSRDLGAQLFCALLRAIAVETRLICSLQALPFSGIAKGETPQKPKSVYINAEEQNYGHSSHFANPSIQKKKKKRIIESPYPIFWVEVYNPAISQWVPVDPIVRHTINKPRTGFEPPASDSRNSMSYVIALEDDGSAVDVTRRYVTWYNAKTRRLRVESTKNGEAWWRLVMQKFRKRFLEVKDEIEEATLVKRVATEGMPKNVQDFKDHPVYVLERHLRANEVIEPKREVGKVTTGVGRQGKLESVYRRQDVQLCRSADAWYRRGRDVSNGEQTLKRVVGKSKRRAGDTGLAEDEDNSEDEGVALYAEYQTELYVPPPIVDGRVPRNAYGNLDVYVSSMIPAGGVHVRHSLAALAAKTLKINYTEAVTGFRFKGRQGTAVVDGIVIDQKYTAAVTSIIEGLEEQSQLDTTVQRLTIFSNIWKRMLAALRVRDRIQQEYGEKNGDDVEMADGDDEDADSTYRDEDEEGGFMPDAEASELTMKDEAVGLKNMKDRLPVTLPDEITKQPIIVVRSPHRMPDPAKEEKPENDLFGSDHGDSDTEMAGGFLKTTEDGSEGDAGGFVRNSDNKINLRVPAEADTNTEAGGFLPEDTDEGGGFIPENRDTERENSDGRLNSARNSTTQFSLQIPGQVTDIAENDTFQDSTVQEASENGANHHNDTARSMSEEADENADSLSPTSLLSHDPEEDDAEPLWLEEAFESD